MNTSAPARWFRMYAEFATDPKVQMLTEADQRRYVMALCLRCSNGDVTLHDSQFAWCLRISVEEWQTTKSRLIEEGLLDDSGHPPSWDKRQYASDASKERVARHRAKKRAAGLKEQVWIPKTLREDVYKRDGNQCVYCGSPDDLSLDHKIPPIRGGAETEIDNLQTCCRICNADKRHMTHDEYLAWSGRVTLLQRPQRTETKEKTETDYSPNGESPPASRGTPCPHDSIIALYHEILCPPCPRVAALNSARKAAMRARWRNELPGLEDWRGYFETVAGSPFLMGRKAGRNGNRPFLADIDFLIRPGTPVKVAEGKYHEDRP